MGDSNQITLLRSLVPTIDGPILEVGSKDYGSTASFRDFYRQNTYVGVDLAAGKGVDRVADLTQGTAGLPEQHFALAVCCSVLEHVPKPWLMAANITRLLRPGGLLYISVPWVWRYHAYPDDYFRFSFRGISSLFDEFDWQRAYYSTTAEGEFYQIDAEHIDVDNALAVHLAAAGGPQRKYLPYLMVNMLGIKRAEARHAA